MTSSKLIRVGGLAAVVAGALLLIAGLWGLVQEFLLRGSSQNFSEVAVTTSFTIMSASS